MNNLILVVDENDKPIEYMEKLEVHKRGLTHRAFSVVLFSKDNKKMLIQRRAYDKYHSGGLWANACCSHQRKGETLEESVKNRLKEELGTSCPVKEYFVFHYRVEFDNNLVEDEIDHVFIGNLEEPININKEEIHEVKWIEIDELKKMDTSNCAYWFKIIINELIKRKII